MLQTDSSPKFPHAAHPTPIMKGAEQEYSIKSVKQLSLMAGPAGLLSELAGVEWKQPVLQALQG